MAMFSHVAVGFFALTVIVTGCSSTSPSPSASSTLTDAPIIRLSAYTPTNGSTLTTVDSYSISYVVDPGNSEAVVSSIVFIREDGLEQITGGCANAGHPAGTDGSVRCSGGGTGQIFQCTAATVLIKPNVVCDGTFYFGHRTNAAIIGARMASAELAAAGGAVTFFCNRLAGVVGAASCDPTSPVLWGKAQMRIDLSVNWLLER